MQDVKYIKLHQRRRRSKTQKQNVWMCACFNKQSSLTTGCDLLQGHRQEDGGDEKAQIRQMTRAYRIAWKQDKHCTNCGDDPSPCTVLLRIHERDARQQQEKSGVGTDDS